MLSGARSRIRRTTRREHAEDGVSLIELVVSMTLMTLIGAMALTFFVQMNRASSQTVDANISTSSARNALEAWTSLLSLADSRTAPGTSSGRFAMITPTEVLFYADVSNRTTACSPITGCAKPIAPQKIDLSIQNGQLIENDYVYASGAYPTTATRTRILATGVTTGGWLFTPYTVGNPPVAQRLALCPSGALGLCTGTAGADTVLGTVVRVDIQFSVTANTGDNAQTFTSSAAMSGSTS